MKNNCLIKIKYQVIFAFIPVVNIFLDFIFWVIHFYKNRKNIARVKYFTGITITYICVFLAWRIPTMALTALVYYYPNIDGNLLSIWIYRYIVGFATSFVWIISQKIILFNNKNIVE